MRTVLRGALVGVVAAGLSAFLAAAGTSPVADAVMKRDKDAVRALLKDGADVNAAQGDGMTALHWAARSGDAELAQMLLYAGANVKATTRLGAYSPLMMAAEQGHAAVIAALLAAGADVKAANTTGTTPLMLAAMSGDAKSVTTLVENGAEVDAREKSMQQTALMIAAATNRVDAIGALLKAGADVKLTSKVNNVGNLSGAEQEAVQAASGSGGQPGGNGQTRNGPTTAAATPPDAAAQGRGQGGGGGFGRGGGGKAGVDRPYFYNELVGTQGGITPLLLAARGGYADAVKAARVRWRRRQPAERRRQDQPAADRHHQRPLRPREVAARPGRQSERRRPPMA